MRVTLAMTCVLALTACGDRLATSGGRSGSTIGATGDISSACLAADRSAATVALCTCIQGVANNELSSNDRRRVARFFPSPETAHAVRISDTDADDAFWERYQNYVSVARRQCG